MLDQWGASPPFIPGEKIALLRPGTGLAALLLAPPSLSQQLTSQEQMANATSPAPSLRPDFHCHLVPWPIDRGLLRPPWCPSDPGPFIPAHTLTRCWTAASEQKLGGWLDGSLNDRGLPRSVRSLLGP